MQNTAVCDIYANTQFKIKLCSVFIRALFHKLSTVTGAWKLKYFELCLTDVQGPNENSQHGT